MKKDKNSTSLSDFQDEEGEIEEKKTIQVASQPEFFKVPRRFGNIPIDDVPTGYDKNEQYRKLYPFVSLPFQPVERVSFGHSELEPNRLFFGDNLHIMRLLPPESIDLIYIDPPFFSGRNYNVIFGDQNEVRSFTDIWEGGMPGYLTWLNARLLEMKRLLKPTGNIFVHLDWHASHYVKIEMDKIFGYDNFKNEIIWKRKTGRGETNHASSQFGSSTDCLLFYGKTDESKFNSQFISLDKADNNYKDYVEKFFSHVDENGRRFQIDNLASPSPRPNLTYEYKGYKPPANGWAISKDKMIQWDKEGRLWFPKNKDSRIRRKRYLDELKGQPIQNLWDDIQPVSSQSNERIGYPTQKPEALLERIISCATDANDVVADFFIGGGTTAAVAQRLGRRWIACDQSKIAVAVTLDRVVGIIQQQNSEGTQHTLGDTPDISLEHWGIYETPALTKLSEEQFRHFIIHAYNGRVATAGDLVHGYKEGVPLFVGPASQDKPVTKEEVLKFGDTLLRKKGKKQGVMLAWAFAPSARAAMEKLAAQQAVALDFVKLDLVEVESPQFSKHITTKHPEYENLLSFVMPPEVRLEVKRLAPHTYEFDISESISINPGGKIMNVQWDFDHKTRFVSTKGYAFLRDSKNNPELIVRYEFPHSGTFKVACKVQDDEGGEKMKVLDLEVS